MVGGGALNKWNQYALAHKISIVIVAVIEFF